MRPTRIEFDPYLSDPDRWGVSLVQLTELIIACLDAARARSVAEVGAFAGDLTRVLVAWASGRGARVVAIDPSPQESLIGLDESAAELELIRQTSLEALTQTPLPDVVIIDGDHNYYTVSEELRLIGERAPGTELPLLLFHDVCWPHGRRDDYFNENEIPPAYRHAVVDGAGGIVPDERGVAHDGLPYPRSAAREGGPRNGVLTAIEDFVGAHEHLRLVVVPAFFGFGAVWHLDAHFAPELAALLDPWDRNPILDRLEASRVHHLARAHQQRVEFWKLQDRLVRQQNVLRRLTESSAFSLAERLSKLRVRLGVAPAQAALSRDDIEAVLKDD